MLLSGCAAPPPVVEASSTNKSRKGILMRGEVLQLISMRQAAQQYSGHVAIFIRLCNKVYDPGNPVCEKTSTIPVLAHIALGRDNPDGKHEWMPIIPIALQGKLEAHDIVEVINFEGFTYVTDVLTKAGEDQSTAKCRWVSETFSGSHIECLDDEKNGWVSSDSFGLGIPIKPYVVWEK